MKFLDDFIKTTSLIFGIISFIIGYFVLWVLSLIAEFTSILFDPNFWIYMGCYILFCVLVIVLWAIIDDEKHTHKNFPQNIPIRKNDDESHTHKNSPQNVQKNIYKNTLPIKYTSDYDQEYEGWREE